jgi:hypothetical protein
MLSKPVKARVLDETGNKSQISDWQIGRLADPDQMYPASGATTHAPYPFLIGHTVDLPG